MLSFLKRMVINPEGSDDRALDTYIHFDPIETEMELYPANGAPPKPILVGVPSWRAKNKFRNQVDDYLNMMKTEIERLSGFNMEQNNLFPEELCVLHKTPDRVVAIPKQALWVNMAYLFKHGWVPLRSNLGFALAVRGYRPQDYNMKLGGAKSSRHLWFQALDIYPGPNENTAENRFRLVNEAVRLYVESGKEHKIGLGIYGSKYSPSHIHLDAGWKQRNWGVASHFISKYRKR